MKIFVTAKPAAKVELVEEIDDTHFRVSVKEPPRQGKANEAVIRAIANHFGVAAQRVRIVAGRASRNKMLEIV
jgi:hypothetical protein